MENNVTINVGVKEVGGSVKSIKQELREAQASAVQMARAFGENSTEATNAAQKVAKLRDEIEDVGLKIKGLNPDKFQRIATLGQGVAQGFVAAQGAMAMFGGQSQELEKTMVKLQGAIAMSQGLQGLKDTQIAFAGLGASAVKAFNTIKASIGSTGIGLVIIALGIAITELIANWDKLNAKNEESIKSQERLKQSLKDTEQGLQEHSKSIAIESDLQIAKLKLADASKQKIREAEAKAVQDQLDYIDKVITLHGEKMAQFSNNANKEEIEEARKQHTKLIEQRTDLAIKLQLLNINQLQQIKDENKKAHDEELAKLKSDNAEKLALHKQYIKDNLAEYTKLADARTLKVNEEIKQEIKLLDRKKELSDDEKKYKREISAQILKNNEIISTTLIAQGEIDKNKAIQQEKEKRDAGFELAKAGMEAVQTLSDMVFADKLSKVKKGSIEEEKILRKQFELNKAMQIGTAVINGLQSILAITSVPDFTMGVASAMRIASQVVLTSATIAKIASTKFNAPAPTSSDLPAPPSQSNLSSVVNQQRNVSGTSTGATGQNQVVKVIVTETDITRTQGRVNDIRRRALIH